MEQLETFINSLIEQNVTPGLSFLAARQDSIIYKNHFGDKSILPKRERLEDDTIYDVASLTKPLITSFLLLYLLEKEKIALDTEVKTFFPELPYASSMTIQHLAAHTSGLPDWFPFYLYEKENYLPVFPTIELTSRPGSSVNYSCVGYILLRYIIEKITGTSFSKLAQDIIISPLNLKRTFLNVPPDKKQLAAPTENGTNFERSLALEWAKKAKTKKETDTRTELIKNFQWRSHVIQGDTHDNNSFYLDGCGGNAGLFTTCADIHRICLEFFPETASILKPASLEPAWKNITPLKKSHRTIGFKRNSSFITSGGRALSRRAIGHNGFTGTCLWLDPRKKAIIITLTNRIHPQYTPYNFNKPRRKVHKIVRAML